MVLYLALFIFLAFKKQFFAKRYQFNQSKRGA